MANFKNILKKTSYADVIRIRKNGPFQDFHEYQLGLDHQHYNDLLGRSITQQCPCCGGTFRDKYLGDDVTEDNLVLWQQILHECIDCGFFKRHMNDLRGGEDYVVPFTQTFSSVKSVSLSHLAREIYVNHEKLYSMSPFRFEQFIGSILGDYFDCEVNYIGQSNDDGIDLVLLQSDEPILVQVKRRGERGRTEGIGVVKNLFASMYGQNASKGLVVSTAQRFSPAAINWINRPSVTRSNIKIDLVDITRLLEIVASVSKMTNAAGWDFFDLDKSTRIFDKSSKSFATPEFVEVTGIDSSKYYYLPSDVNGLYKLSNSIVRIENADDILDNSTRINGASFFRNLRNLKTSTLFVVLKNWAKYHGRLLYEDDTFGKLVGDKLDLEPDDKSYI